MPTMSTYVATDYRTWGPKETVALEHVTGAQGPSRLITRHVTRPNPLPENTMPDVGSPLDINHDSGMNAGNQGYGSTADVNTLGPQVLVTIPRNTYTRGSNLCQQQSLPRENTHAHNANEHFVEANETTDSMALGVSDNVDGISRGLHWQRDGDGTWAHAQVHIEAQIRDSYVLYTVEAKRFTVCCRMIFLWPSDMSLAIHAVGIDTWNLQEWIQRNHAAVSRIKCPPGMERRDFYGLVKSLRKNCGVSPRQVSTMLPSHALLVRDCMVGGQRYLSGTTPPCAAWPGPPLRSVSCRGHPGASSISIPWARPYTVLCSPELPDTIQTSPSIRSCGHAYIC
jgi:hypothetical protein